MILDRKGQNLTRNYTLEFPTPVCNYLWGNVLYPSASFKIGQLKYTNKLKLDSDLMNYLEFQCNQLIPLFYINKSKHVP